MRSAVVVVAILLAFSAGAQTSIIGRIVDSATQAPLGYASVHFVGTSTGTITNADGAFRIPAGTAIDSIRVSYVGYRTRSVAIGSLRPQTPIELDRSIFELAEFRVSADDLPYQRIVKVARRLHKVPETEARIFFGMETHSDTVPVEMIHAYYNASYRTAGLKQLDLKQGRIGIAQKDGRYFINYNTTRAFALMDILWPQEHFPASPLEHTAVKSLKRHYRAELISRGQGTDAVDHLRVSPRDSAAGAFTLDLWLDPTDDGIRALELHCTACPKHPFQPLFEHGRIDTVDMRYRQTWSTEAPAVPEVMELGYRMIYTGPGFTEDFRTHAVMHAFDRSGTFIPTLFQYPRDLADYRKIGWLPEDTSFWQRMSPPLPTERQQRDRAFLNEHDLRNGTWYERLDNDRNFFGAHYAIWSPERRVWLNAMAQQYPDGTTSLIRPGLFGGHAIAYKRDEVVLVAQLYLDLDTVQGRLLHRSATVLDGFRTYDFTEEQPWTACFYNIWFDLCEMERRAMEVRLGDPGITVEQARSIHALHTDRLRATTAQYLRETRNGADCLPLFKWSDKVKRALGIDNIMLLGL